MDLTTAVNSLGSDYVNKVSDLLTNKTNTASGTTDDSSFDSVFNAVSGLLDSIQFIYSAGTAGGS